MQPALAMQKKMGLYICSLKGRKYCNRVPRATAAMQVNKTRTNHGTQHTVQKCPVNAIMAVTSVAARYLRQQENIGSIAAGHYADSLVIDGEPLRDPRELRRLTIVYRGGLAYKPEALLAQVPKSTVGQAA